VTPSVADPGDTNVVTSLPIS